MRFSDRTRLRQGFETGSAARRSRVSDVVASTDRPWSRKESCGAVGLVLVGVEVGRGLLELLSMGPERPLGAGPSAGRSSCTCARGTTRSLVLVSLAVSPRRLPAARLFAGRRHEGGGPDSGRGSGGIVGELGNSGPEGCRADSGERGVQVLVGAVGADQQAGMDCCPRGRRRLRGRDTWNLQ